MSTEESPEPKQNIVKAWAQDRKYPISASVGLIILISTIIIVYFTKGEASWGDILFYPILIYFTFQQILSGFGFITGYIPIGIDIINWLSKTAKKKSYDEKDLEKLDKKHDNIESNEKREMKKYDKLLNNLKDEEKKAETKFELGKWSQRKYNRVKKKLEDRKKNINKDKANAEDNFQHDLDEIKEKQKEYRGRVSEKIITKQEGLDPAKFKLIMLVPIYVMLVLGLILSAISFINPIIRLANGTPLPGIDTLDIINEYYKGIIAGWGIISFYIIPAIRILRDPSKEYVQRIKVVEEKKRRFRFFRRKKKEDPRTLLNRQFEDLRKYYWDIKQMIGKALLIPIGLSMLVAAPIGAMSVSLGVQTSIRRQKSKRHELVIQIIVGITLIGMLVYTYFSFFARYLKSGIHESIPIILKIIYTTFLILSFVLFTRQPIAHRGENKES
ncbi:MAG: hypothetical protein ACTSSH_08375 [Candidatus Heimdallarchaeota archaeon]